MKYRTPAMSRERYQRVKRVFLDACAAEPSARAAVLDLACGEDLELRTEVESLLAHQQHSDDFLDQPWIERPRLDLSDPDLTSLFPRSAPQPLPHTIAGYRIIDLLGEGGMGIVYRARQDNPRRTVALKVVRSSLASEPMIRRFEHEAQILGRLAHPGIAQIYQAGTADTGSGPQPFFAMELVSGASLGQHIEANQLSIHQRLQLIAQVCDAVHHAHQKGVIHRDLKPNNILVDDAGRPRILDFGVGRIIDDPDAADTMRTLPGQLMGTLAYMSPEQVEGRRDDLDTRTDIYALGVILYEALSGQLPHDLNNRSIAQCVRIISQDDVRPLGRINRALRGDLETIAAKALEKDKARRYQSASDLAADIRRHLAHQPILARPQTPAYTMAKLARRKPMSLLSAVLAIGLLIAIPAYLSQLSLKQQSKQLNIDLFATYSQDLERDLQVDYGDTLTPRETDIAKLEKYAAFAAAQVNDQPLPAARLWDLVGRNYMLGDHYDLAERYIDLGLQTRRTTPGATTAEIGDSLISAGRLKWHQGDFASAEDYLRESLAARTVALGPRHADVARTLHVLASTLRDQQRFDEALAAADEALNMRLNLLQPDDDDMLASFNNIASIHEAMGQFADAAARYERLLALIEPKFGPDMPRVARTKRRLASCLIHLDQFDDAEALLTEALTAQQRQLGTDHSDVAATHVQLGRLNLARANAAADDADRAELLDLAHDYARTALDIQQRKLGPNHPETAKSSKLLQEIESLQP